MPPILVYGDSTCLESAAAAVASIRGMLRDAERSAGLDRHALLVGAFIRAAELAQGLADAAFERCGKDRPDPRNDSAAELLVLLAVEIDRSWRTGFCRGASSMALIDPLLDRLASGGTIASRRAEGFAHYALYPESYLEAARRSGLDRSTCVIGIRSIGLGLAALLAAALGVEKVISLRPVGHPLTRQISAEPGLVAGCVADGSVQFAIVDEGPGLSGSSFAAVVCWLEGLGVETARIHLFPSHDSPPGARASAGSLRAWNACTRHVASFDSTVLRAGQGGGGLRTWLSDLLGPHELADISGGRWRGLIRGSEGEWPPCDVRMERRKYLLLTESGPWIARFAGLGEHGLRKLRMAKVLAKEGFVPDVAGLRHGFLVERWQEGRSLDRSHFARDGLLRWLGSYLGARRRLLPAWTPGAGPDELCRMAVQNAGEALGAPAAARLARWFAENPGMAGQPVAMDGRLHAWEFAVSPEGALVKTDALDHCQSHDLVGCQDIAWDVAGAIAEHALTAEEAQELCALVGASGGHAVDPRLVAFYRPCYLAFQLGFWHLAAEASAGAERLRLQRAAARYRSALGTFIDRPAGSGPLS